MYQRVPLVLTILVLVFNMGVIGSDVYGNHNYILLCLGFWVDVVVSVSLIALLAFRLRK
jgi:hypothetical protein